MSGTRKIATIMAGDKLVGEVLTAPSALSEDSDIVSQCLYVLCETIIRGLMPDERGGGLGGEFGYGVNFENDAFVMRRFYWGDCDCGSDENDEPHKPTCSLERPNFLHKRTGLEIRWYKWIGRDMEAKPETIIDWGAIWTECMESIPREAHEKAKTERQHESTPEYKAAQEEAMQAMMAAMDKMFSEMQPCYRCSMDENAFMVGGQTETGGGVKINTVLLDENGACPNCGHVTTDAELELIAERRKTLDAAFRERFASHS